MVVESFVDVSCFTRGLFQAFVAKAACVISVCVRDQDPCGLWEAMGSGGVDYDFPGRGSEDESVEPSY